MTNNEKLIEDAAKAIFAEEQCDRHQKRNAASVTENWEVRLGDADKDEYRSFARVALAVFEKAHTPTDDIASKLATALVHTVEYVGNDVLPVLEGWSWYDALLAYDEALIAEWRPVHPVTSADDEREARPCRLPHVAPPCIGCKCGADGTWKPQAEPSPEVPEPSAENFRQQITDERARQIAAGYDILHDLAHGVDHLLTWAQDYVRRGLSVQVAALVEAAREMLREGAK